MVSGVYRALLFDLDGTLTETDSLHLPAWADALRPHGIEVDEAFFMQNFSGRDNSEILTELLPNLSGDEGRSLVERKERVFRERATDLEPLPGLVDFVESARGRGLRIALVTNAPRENVTAILAALGMEEDFEEIIVSGEVGGVKPDPTPYKAALKRLGVAPEDALAFEDSSSGISSAVGAGVPTVGIASTQRPDTLREAGAFMVAGDFTDRELLRLLAP